MWGIARLAAVYFLVIAAQIWASPCNDDYKRLLKTRVNSEDALLLAFNPDTLIIKETTLLATTGVLKLTDHQGVSYVIRPGSDDHYLGFELFATAVARRAPGFQAPNVRLLSLEESRKLETRLNGGRAERPLVPGVPRFSVAVFYPAETGRDYLQRLCVMDPVRDAILDAVLSGFPYMDVAGRKIRDGWEKLTPKQKKILIADLKSAWPLAATIKLSDVPGFLAENVGRMTRESALKFFYTGLKRLPPEVETQLADYWALSTVLGVPDPHVSNWLIHNGKVMGVDFASPGDEFEEGKKTIKLGTHQHPLGHFVLTAGLRKRLLEKVSPGMRAFLLGLDRHTLRELAREQKFIITEDQIAGILGRADRVLEGP